MIDVILRLSFIVGSMYAGSFMEANKMPQPRWVPIKKANNDEVALPSRGAQITHFPPTSRNRPLKFLSLTSLRSRLSNISSPDFPRESSQITPWLWFHVHKVGGTLMCETAKRYTRIVEPHANCQWQVGDAFFNSGKPRSTYKTCAQRTKIWKASNFRYGQIERELLPTDICDGFKYGTSLRDPVSLALSDINYRYFYWEKKSKPLQEVVTEFKRQLNHTSARPVGKGQDHQWKFLDNFQTRQFANAFDVPAGGINHEHFLRAKRALEKFDVVVRIEDFGKPGVWARLFAALGWGVPRSPPHKENARRKQFFSFSGEEEEWLRQQNKYDHDLHSLVDIVSLKMPGNDV